MTAQEHAAGRRRAKILTQVSALVAAALGVVGCAAVPLALVMSDSGTGSDDPPAMLIMLALLGPGILALPLIPVILTALPLISRRKHSQTMSLVSMALLTAFVMGTLSTFGLFFLPALALAVVAVVLPPRS
jgi:cation transport ATPase